MALLMQSEAALSAPFENRIAYYTERVAKKLDADYAMIEPVAKKAKKK